MTEMVAFYFFNLDQLIGKETLLFLTQRNLIRFQNFFENISAANQTRLIQYQTKQVAGTNFIRNIFYNIKCFFTYVERLGPASCGLRLLF